MGAWHDTPTRHSSTASSASTGTPTSPATAKALVMAAHALPSRAVRRDVPEWARTRPVTVSIQSARQSATAVRDGSVIPCSPTRLGVRNSGFARVCVRHRQSGVRVCTHRVGMRQSCRSIRPSNRMGNQRADGNGMRMPAGDLFIRIPACQPIEARHPVDGDAGVHDALSVSYRAGARFPRRDR